MSVLDPQIVRFICVGVLNTAIGILVIFIAGLFLNPYTANFIGYLFVVPVSFFAHRQISFKDKGNWVSAFARYLPTVGFGYLGNLVTLHMMLSVAPTFIAQISGISAHVLITFLLSKFIVFLNPQKAH